MTDEIRVSSLIRSYLRERPKELQEFREEALQGGVPVLREETEALLSFFMTLLKPEAVLEIGTAVGYSGTVMLLSQKDARLLTVEKDEERAAEAEKRFRDFGLSDRATVLRGDFTDVGKTVSDTFDFIFLDAAKAQYVTWLPMILEKLRPGGLLVTDNIFQEGDTLESHYLIRRRDRTINKRIRDFLETLRENPEVENIISNTGDGVCLTVKKE